MSSPLTLLCLHGGATYDLSGLCGSATLAGAVGQVARTLDFPLLSARNDSRQPRAPVAIGDNVQLFCGGGLLFDGFVFSLQRDSGRETVDVGCWDRGIYLKQNQAHYTFTGQTAEAITHRVCRDFGIQAGELAQTDIPLRRTFPGVSLYQIVQTGYTLAARQTGESYLQRFRGAALEVIIRKRETATHVLRAGGGLLTATVKEDASKAVSQVGIYDANGNLLRTRENEELKAQIGAFRKCIKTAKDKDADAEARQLLEENGLDQNLTVVCLGDPSLLTGGSVIVREPVTGLYGLYWIDADTHTWKNGAYQTKLTLSLKKTMDEAEAGKAVE